MTRPDKHRAHFGDRYPQAVDRSRLRKDWPAITDAIRRMTEAFRRYNANPAPPSSVTFQQDGPIRVAPVPDILDRIDSALMHFTDAQTGPGDTEWPYGGQF